MDLQRKINSNTTYKITVENTHYLGWLNRSSIEGAVERGLYQLSKNFPIKEYEYTDNIGNNNYVDMYITIGDIQTDYTLQELWNYFQKNANALFGYDLDMVSIEVINENEKPDLDTWWEDMFDEIPKGVKTGYKEIKFILILLVALYLLNIATDITEIFDN